MRQRLAMTGLAVLALIGAGTLLLARPGPPPTAPGVPVPAAPPPLLRVMALIEPGLWDLKSLSGSGKPLHLCVRDPRQLLQPLHPLPLCKPFIAGEGPDHVTLSYDCGARGQGHTALRVETPRLVQIDSQGVANGRPFAVRLEGRRVGACPATAH